MRKKAGFIVLSMALAGSLMGCSFSLNKDADGSSKKIGTTVTEETGKTDETTGTDTGADTETSEETSSAAGSDGKASAHFRKKKKWDLEPVKCRKRIRITWLLIRKCPGKCRRKMGRLYTTYHT